MVTVIVTITTSTVAAITEAVECGNCIYLIEAQGRCPQWRPARIHTHLQA